MLRRWLCQADVDLVIEPVGPILIKSGHATLDGPDMVPVSTMRNGERTYYFPGSSLKGVLRSHFERICRSLREASVCIPYRDPTKKDQPVPVPSELNSFGCGYRDGDDAPKARYYRNACPACRLFGSLRYTGRVSIGDAYPVTKATSSPRDGVGIDRFTGGTVSGVLFNLSVIDVGAKFKAQIRVTNFELWQLGAVNFLLQDLKDQMLSIGSGRSRGLGRVGGAVEQYHLTYLQNSARLQGLADLATEEERREYGLSGWQPAQTIDLPSGTRRGLRWQYDLSGDWETRTAELVPALDAFLTEHPRPLGVVSQRESSGGRR
jgi:CRISPR-associated RAMP protein (TIGR02581 family)